MGVCCGASQYSSSQLVDLAPPSVDVNDKIAEWEASLPFARTSMSAFVHHLNEAHSKSGGNGEVTLGNMINQFNSPAWSCLKIQSNSTHQWLKLFCSNESGDGFSYKKLMMLGLLHCQDAKKPKNKAIALYGLLQEGGAEKQTHIASADKDLKSVLHSMFSLATTEPLIASGQCARYSDEQIEKIANCFYAVSGVEIPSSEENAVEGDGENTVVDKIFNVCAKVTYEVFIEQTIAEVSWVFKPTELRKRIWRAADLEELHKQQ